MNKGPNKPDSQKNNLKSFQKLKKLNGDRFDFYLASDGIAKGSPLYTITGRLLAGEK